MSSVLGIYIFCSFFMTGVIWLIQLIHYPTFMQIRAADFVYFHKKHTTVMSALVGPMMIAELITALILARHLEFYWIVHVFLIASLWCLTFFVSVPIHNKLESGQQVDLVTNLIKTNWPRTLIWTVKAALLFMIQI